MRVTKSGISVRAIPGSRCVPFCMDANAEDRRGCSALLLASELGRAGIFTGSVCSSFSRRRYQTGTWRGAINPQASDSDINGKLIFFHTDAITRIFFISQIISKESVQIMSKMLLWVIVVIGIITGAITNAYAGSCSGNNCKRIKINAIRVFSGTDLVLFRMDTPADPTYCALDSGWVWVESPSTQQIVYKSLLSAYLTRESVNIRLKATAVEGQAKQCVLRFFDLTR